MNAAVPDSKVEKSTKKASGIKNHFAQPPKIEVKIFNSFRHKTKNTHGTGCTLSSAITTFLSCGKPIKKSCELGIKYVSFGIKTNPKYGKGHGPINHLHPINIERKFR